MTTMKKLFALMLAVLMLLSVCAVAGASEPGNDTATVTVIDGHKFSAYQIFTGTQAESEGTWGNVSWGTGINETEFLNALKNDNSDAFLVDAKNDAGETIKQNAFKDCATAEDVANALKQFGNNSAAAKRFAQLAYGNKNGNGTTVTAGENSELPKGYYLIVDSSIFNDDQTNTAYNTALLQVTDNIVIDAKTSVPEVVKKVKDADDTAKTESGWQDSADHDIGDNVSFQLTATLADNVSAYETYKVVFHDTLSAGLTYNEKSVVVKFDEKDVTSEFLVDCKDSALTISCDDVKRFGATDNSVITVEYTAKLNENAAIGSKGNPNTVYLEYSNNPNESQSGNTFTGKTPEDKVMVFTYKVVVDKVDSSNNPLPGAVFTLEKIDNNEEIVQVTYTVQTNDDGTTFTFEGLDDGTYHLTETKTPAGYNTIEPITFEIKATHDLENDNPALTELTGVAESGEITLTSDTTNDDALETTIINKSGATLPETGGIGTTIFYVAGGVLVLLAVVLLVTKRRVGENN